MMAFMLKLNDPVFKIEYEGINYKQKEKDLIQEYNTDG